MLYAKSPHLFRGQSDVHLTLGITCSRSSGVSSGVSLVTFMSAFECTFLHQWLLFVTSRFFFEKIASAALRRQVRAWKGDEVNKLDRSPRRWNVVNHTYINLKRINM